MKVKKYELETVDTAYAILPKEDNKLIVETAGFIPLDVKFKRFEQAGIAAQFQTNEFTANDFRQLYANPDFELYPDDEFEEVQEKLAAYEKFRMEFLKSHQAGTQEPVEKKDVTKNVAEKKPSETAENEVAE